MIIYLVKRQLNLIWYDSQKVNFNSVIGTRNAIIFYYEILKPVRVMEKLIKFFKQINRHQSSTDVYSQALYDNLSANIII